MSFARSRAAGGLSPLAVLTVRLAILTVCASAALHATTAQAGVEVYAGPPPPAGLALRESPSLEAEVAEGKLPPVAERLPLQFNVSGFSGHRVPGRPGGALKTMINKAKDTRLLTVYGYSRLIGFDETLNLVPDILRRIEVEDGRRFVLKLREGHRWSDGHPFTSADFRYYWEDMANNEDLAPSGPPKTLKVEGRLPEVSFPDATTVIYEWHKPNPFFLTALAGARPLFIYMPGHYLKQFHKRYADPASLAAKVEESGARNWAALHNRRDNLYRMDNPDLPSLQPWVNTTWAPSERFVAKRNPYFHRVGPAGHQLPYIDTVMMQVVGGSLIPAKTGAGDSDLQSRGLAFSDYTFLKAGEKRSNYGVRLWRTVRGSQVAVYPNLNVNDPVWRELLRDVRFRRALSLSIDRHELNQVIYFGLGLEGNQSILPGSALYKSDYRDSYADYDPVRANALLDELGLTARDDRGLRLLPDGRPMEIVVETAGENSEEVDLLELMGDSFLKAGIKLYSKPLQREVLRNRIFAGETLVSMWYGYENAVPTAEMSPEEFAPVRQHSYQWPKWGQYHETSGRAGEPVDMAEPKELMALYEGWINAKSRREKEDVWHRILEIHADQVYSIGLVAQIPQPIVVSNRLRNVPKEAIYNWDPGAQFGIYRPDCFWLEQ